MSRAAVIALVLGSCFASAPAADPEPAAVARTVASTRTIYASSEMAPDCQDAVDSAVHRLSARGLDLSLAFVPLDHRVFWLEPDPGEVSVRSDFDEHTPIAPVLAYVWRGLDGRAERVEIVLQVCTDDVVHAALARALDRSTRAYGRDPSERPLEREH